MGFLLMNYFDELTRAMEWLAEQPNTLFLGQSVAAPGTVMSKTLRDVDSMKRLELPVAEEMQLGMSIGLSIQGIVPVSIFPRWNFLLLATNQLVNHLDKLPLYSDYKPKVIIRTAAGGDKPLNPGPQHIGDFTEAFRLMLQIVNVVKLIEPGQIVPAYQAAYRSKDSTILVEYGNLG